MLRPPLQPLLRPLLRAPIEWSGASLASQIAALFANGELGTAQFPFNAASLYQDSAAVSLVTAPGQALGVVLDTKSGLSRGSELWSDASVSFTGEASRVSPGVYRILSSAGALSAASVTGLVVGRSYEIVLTVDSVTVVGAGITNDAAAGTSATYTTTGQKRAIIEAAGTTASIKRVASACDIQVSNMSVKEVLGGHGRQTTAGLRPLYQDGPSRIIYDGVNDAMTIKFSASLGGSCTIARAIPGVGASILTGQTIGTSYSDSTSNCGLVIINRALTAAETTTLTGILDRLSFASVAVGAFLVSFYGEFLTDSVGNFLVV